jgi:hypothetical protein
MCENNISDRIKWYSRGLFRVHIQGDRSQSESAWLRLKDIGCICYIWTEQEALTLYEFNRADWVLICKEVSSIRRNKEEVRSEK